MYNSGNSGNSYIPLIGRELFDRNHVHGPMGGYVLKKLPLKYPPPQTSYFWAKMGGKKNYHRKKEVKVEHADIGF